MTSITAAHDRDPVVSPRLVLNRDVAVGVGIGILLTALSYAIGAAFGWIDRVDPLEAFAVATSYACTYLCVTQRRFNYVIGAMSTATYAVLFLTQGLYASMALNLYLVPTLVYGWVRWRSDAEPRPVTRVRPRWALVYAGVAAIALAGALAIVSAFGGSYALTDSAILVGSVLAQFLMDNKKIENWVVWFAVDVLAVWEYAAAGLSIAALQYVLFLVNAVWGFSMWRRSMIAGRVR